MLDALYGDGLVRLLGAILAGGKSSRFGQDKADAKLRGASLLEHARRTISPFVETTINLRAGEVADFPAAHQGPLGGLAGAMLHARASGHSAILLSACDIPEIPDGLIPRLIAQPPAFVVEAPVIGCWPVALFPELVTFLEGRDRSMRGWAKHCGALPVHAGMPIANINYAQDLHAAELPD